MSAIARIFGVTPPPVSRWVKKGCAAGRQPAVIAYYEMRTYRQARHGDKRPDWWMWIWTAVAAEPAGRRGADFEVGDR